MMQAAYTTLVPESGTSESAGQSVASAQMPVCAAVAPNGLIDGQWAWGNLFHLLAGTFRSSELRRHRISVTPRMLTDQRREREDDGLSVAPILLALKDLGGTIMSVFPARADA